MIRTLVILTLHDLAIACKNKSVYLMIFIPVFVICSLKLVDRVGTDGRKSTIGIVEHASARSEKMQVIAAAESLFRVTVVATEALGRQQLKDNLLDGLLVHSGGAADAVTLVVLKKESLRTLAIVEKISLLQQGAEGRTKQWLSGVTAIQSGGIQSQTLPTWILMLVLLVGFIILPAQVAEEKEKQLLLALLQTPMREMEWLLAKVFSGMILICAALLMLALLGAFSAGFTLGCGVIIVGGAFCFCSSGVLLGFLCRNQASARTLGVMFYLPHLLPSALADFSHKLSSIAPFLTSYYLYEPLKSMLLNDSGFAGHGAPLCILILVGAVMLIISWLLMKRRWLM
jgi:ABC-2 type transport system permease protein